MIDIDHFKSINDEFGHQVGDRVLAGLGKLIADSCRDSDIAARYGGEEILTIEPNTAASSAGQFAERLRRAVEWAALIPADAAHNDRQLRITVSIGVAELDGHTRDAPAILAHADKALYHAKSMGRNRIALSGSPVPCGS
jgi:diguanylate cyclase (GGDEF)-like protein